MHMFNTMGAAAGVAKCLCTLRIPDRIATIQMHIIYGSIIEHNNSPSRGPVLVSKKI